MDHDTNFVSALIPGEVQPGRFWSANPSRSPFHCRSIGSVHVCKVHIDLEHEPGTAGPRYPSFPVLCFKCDLDASPVGIFVDVPAKTITVVHNPLGSSAQTMINLNLSVSMPLCCRTELRRKCGIFRHFRTRFVHRLVWKETSP
jgi:hypothetical protein